MDEKQLSREVNALILTPEKAFQRKVNQGFGIKSGLYFDESKSESFGEAVKNQSGEGYDSMIVAEDAKRAEGPRGLAETRRRERPGASDGD